MSARAALAWQRVVVPEGAAIVQGKRREEIGQLEGKSTKHTGVSFWPDYNVTDDRAKIDWIVRGNIGQEFGHFPTREEAELAAEPLARKREAELIVHLPDGRMSRKSFKKGMGRQIARDDRPELTDARHALTPSTCSRVHARSWAKGITPDWRAISPPWCTSINVGMLWIE